MRARHTSSRHYHEYQLYMTVPNAAIQAQNLEGFLYLLLVTNMEKLTQPQMVLSLRAYGEEAPKTWTRVQLMARLKELEAQGEVTAPTTKKMKTPLEEAVKELNRAAARKATLQKYVQEGCGLTITGNETISVLQQKAMTHLLATVEASAKDPLGFGKYSTQSYEHVKINDPRYCEWAIQTAKEGQCSDYLRRFAKWLETPKPVAPKETGKTKIDIGAIVEQAKQEGYPKASMDKTTTRTTVKQEMTPPTTTPVAATSSNDPGPMIQQLVLAVSSLAQEVQALKDDKEARPRKVVAQQDAVMKPDADQDGK